MKQIFYTQEGTGYILKSIHTSTPVVQGGGPLDILRGIFVNWPAGAALNHQLAINPLCIPLQTNQKIIPVSYTLSIQDAVSHDTVCDVSECYYSVDTSTSMDDLPNYRAALAKAVPYIQRVYFTDEMNHSFCAQYNQMVFADNDFMNPSDQLLIKFMMSITDAMNNQESPSNVASLPVGSYNVTTTFCYYELLPK